MDTSPVSMSTNGASHNARYQQLWLPGPSTRNERHHDRQLLHALISVIHILSNYVLHFLNLVSLLTSSNGTEIAFWYQRLVECLALRLFKVPTMPNI